jgi:hypothetical protein
MFSSASPVASLTSTGCCSSNPVTVIGTNNSYALPSSRVDPNSRSKRRNVRLYLSYSTLMQIIWPPV